MEIIKLTPNGSGAYPNMQSWPGEVPPAGHGEVRCDTSEFYKYNGFVVLTTETEDRIVTHEEQREVERTEERPVQREEWRLVGHQEMREVVKVDENGEEYTELEPFTVEDYEPFIVEDVALVTATDVETITVEEVVPVVLVTGMAGDVEAWEAWKAEPEPEPQATLDDRVATLETNSAEMAEALDMILSGVTE